MSEIETIYLDTMDGFDFESICARIFEKLEWGKVERIGMVGDGGRDLVIHQQSGSIVVECKHQPKTSIGRPIVQKLHSAVISTGAIRGIIITTGKFSKEAIEHAKLLSKKTPIELYDFSQFSQLAREAKIKLVYDGKDATIFRFPILDIPDIKEKLRKRLEDFQSYPASPFELMKLIPTKLFLSPSYIANVNICQEFATTVGKIHTINEKNKFLLFSNEGGLFQADWIDFLKNATLTEFRESPTIACPIYREKFYLHTTTLSNNIKNEIIRALSPYVSYVGDNNVSYTKHCKIGPRSISLNDIKHVLLPFYGINFKCINQEYPCELFLNDNQVKLKKRLDLCTCKICNHSIEGKKLLCNDCGNITHSPKFFSSESYICKNCKKTICKNCTFWWRRILFFKKILCESCADMKPKSKKKLVKKD